MSNFFGAGKAACMSEKMDWETPQALYDELNAEFNFTLDPASTDTNAKCEHHYTELENGLAQSWEGERVFVNPPYGRNIGEWVKKCKDESKRAECIVCLIPARTDTRYFHDFIYGKGEIRFIRGRLKFEHDGEAGQAAPFPSMIVVWNGKDKVVE